MACVEGKFQPHLHDAMVMGRDSIKCMSDIPSVLEAPSGVKLTNLRIHERQNPSVNMHSTITQHQRSSFVKRCCRLATGRRPSITSTYSTIQPPTVTQWVQRLPSCRSEHEDFLESALEEAVGQLVSGPNVAAEELELGYNYVNLEDAAPEAWVRVQAQRVEVQGKHWIAASIQSKAEPGEKPEVYAYGRWICVKTKRHY